MFYRKPLLVVLFILLTGSAGACLAQSSPDYTLFDPLVDVCDLIQKHYVEETKDQDLVTGAINGMLHKLDPYSEFIPEPDVSEFQKQTSGSYEGIGIGIDIKNGILTVISPFENSPAYQAGVLAGDRILEVDNKSTKGWSTTRAVKELTGSAETDVTIKVLHLDGVQETITITRKQIHIPTIRGWRRKKINGFWDFMLEEKAKIGYIRLIQFTSDSVSELDAAIDQLNDQQMKALIFDLRSNHGGLLGIAVETVNRFIDKGIIVSTRGAHSGEKVQKATAAGTYRRFPLVVIIDHGSASASEIVAGALQDHSRAIIVGQRSWGKGSAQQVFRLPDSGHTVKLTTEYYYLPKGRCVHRRPGAETWGVDPDIEETIDTDKIPQLRKFMNKLTVEPLTQAKPDDQIQPDLADEQAHREKQAQKLLRLDAQLDQAVKQCKGLLRARPTLQSLTETFTEN